MSVPVSSATLRNNKEGYSWAAARNMPRMPSAVTASDVCGATSCIRLRQKILFLELMRRFKHPKNPVRKATVSSVPDRTDSGSPSRTRTRPARDCASSSLCAALWAPSEVRRSNGPFLSGPRQSRCRVRAPNLSFMRRDRSAARAEPGCVPSTATS